mmetsp:Transcript_27408/g.65804  ORF Transcript_27408/g.65804 Transcript_27408/m.65804 type:complete len:702 (+) Transcript_27408:144-2249(+)
MRKLDSQVSERQNKDYTVATTSTSTSTLATPTTTRAYSEIQTTFDSSISKSNRIHSRKFPSTTSFISSLLLVLLIISRGETVLSFPSPHLSSSSASVPSSPRRTTSSVYSNSRDNIQSRLKLSGGHIDHNKPPSQKQQQYQSSSSMSSSASPSTDHDNDDDDSKLPSESSHPHNQSRLSPRSASCLFMSIAMALHFGGYEFCRSGAMALLTSKVAPHGFGNFAAAYPFFMGLVTPVSLSLVYGYGRVLKSSGPRNALKVSTAGSVGVLGICSLILMYMNVSGMGMSGVSDGLMSSSPILAILPKVVMAVLFIFQNSYAHLIYTQEWSFLGSVMTPKEGTKWFSLIAGLSSVVCTLTAKMVPTLLRFFRQIHTDDSVGLLGLVLGTCATLFLSLIFADWAYKLAEDNGFDPKPTTPTKEMKSSSDVAAETEESLIGKTKRMFRTSKTLSGLFCEVISFQALSTALNVCFIQQLQQSILNDTDRAGFTSQFYALVNGSSGLMQFFVLPMARKYLEPRFVYRYLPLVLMPLLLFATITITKNAMTSAAASVAAISIPFLPSMDAALFWSALAFFALKSTDYSIRNVSNELVYQPLSFDERYLGKEVNGVVANRVGKSGSSMVLSWITFLFPGSWGRTAGATGIRNLSQLSVAIGAIWSTCSVWLSGNVISNKQAEQKVNERRTDRNLPSSNEGGDNSNESKKND